MHLPPHINLLLTFMFGCVDFFLCWSVRAYGDLNASMHVMKIQREALDDIVNGSLGLKYLHDV